MVQTADQPQANSAPRCRAVGTGFSDDDADALRAALTPLWVTERIIDPAGEVSLAVLAADDDPNRPTFLLHEREAVPHVAVIAGDEWTSDRPFRGWPEAVAAIVALAATASGPVGSRQDSRAAA